MFAIVVLGLYGIIYAAPRIEGIGIKTEVIEYGDLPIADTVTALFVRDETLYTAAYSGIPEYMVDAGTKVRAGTQVVYIAPASEPLDRDAVVIPPNIGVPLGAVNTGEDEGPGAGEAHQLSIGSGSEDDPEGPDGDTGDGYVEGVTRPRDSVNPYEALAKTAGDDAVFSEGGVTPWTAIVSYYGDGWEKKVTPENMMSLQKSVLDEAPPEAMNMMREWVKMGEPVYRITNNNLWHVVFWLENADKTVLDKYTIGRKLNLDLSTTKVRATVEAAEPRGRDLFVVLSSDMYYRDLDRYRVRELSVVFSEVSGAIIEKRCVKLKAGEPGVYVKQQNGNFKWVPVKVLRESGDYYLIAETSFENNEGKRVSTIRYYDEIMSNPAAQGY